MLLMLLFFTDTAPTEIYTLSLHDALPICAARRGGPGCHRRRVRRPRRRLARLRRRAADPRVPRRDAPRDRKSTRLNSSHVAISYAVFCLKKKNKTTLT